MLTVKSPPWHMNPGMTRWNFESNAIVEMTRTENYIQNEHRSSYRRPLEAKALLASAEGTEVLNSLWDNIRTKFHHNTA